MRVFLTKLFQKFRFTRRLTLSEERLNTSKRQWKSISRVLRKKEKRINSLYRELSDLRVDIEGELQSAKQVVRDQEELISSLRDQLRTANEITIPALVDINKLLNERIEASTAAEIRSKLSSRIE